MSELLIFVLGQSEQFRRARLPSLYSDFNLQRHSNPDGFAANIAAWTQALSKAARAGLLPTGRNERDTLSLRAGDELLRALETKEFGRPLALGTVINEAISQGHMMLYHDFLSTHKSIYSRNWTVQPWRLLSWGLRHLGLLDTSTASGGLPVGRVVLVQNVEEAASRIIEQMGNKSNRISRLYPIPIFRSEAAKLINAYGQLTESDLQILLVYLARDKSAIVYDSQTVKFKGPEDASSTLSTQDRTIASLKAILADMDNQVALLASRISNLTEVAKTAVSDKNRISALAALRSKKLNENVLAQKTEVLSRLEEVYNKIEQAADQVAIFRVMEASADVLRNLNAEVGGTGKVEDVLEGLRDGMSKVDEVSSLIEAGGEGNSVIDEAGIDEELKKLERQSKAEQEEKEVRQTEERLATIGENGEIRSQEKPQANEGMRKPQSTSRAPDKASDALIEEDISAFSRLSLQEERAAMVGNADEDSATSAERVLDIAS